MVGPGAEVWQFPCHAWFGHSDCGDFVGARGCRPRASEPRRGTACFWRPAACASHPCREPEPTQHSPPPGALERNLIPVKADHKLPTEAIIGEPVAVSAAGLAFPHPEKARAARVRPFGSLRCAPLALRRALPCAQCASWRD